MTTNCAFFVFIYWRSFYQGVRKLKAHNNQSTVRTRLKRAVILSVLLGLTWTSGLVLFAHGDIALQVIFTILVSSQGLFIAITQRGSFLEVAGKKIKKERRNRAEAASSPRLASSPCRSSTSTTATTMTDDASGVVSILYLHFQKRWSTSEYSISGSDSLSPDQSSLLRRMLYRFSTLSPSSTDVSTLTKDRTDSNLTAGTVVSGQSDISPTKSSSTTDALDINVLEACIPTSSTLTKGRSSMNRLNLSGTHSSVVENTSCVQIVCTSPELDVKYLTTIGGESIATYSRDKTADSPPGRSTPLSCEKKTDSLPGTPVSWEADIPFEASSVRGDSPTLSVQDGISGDTEDKEVLMQDSSVLTTVEMDSRQEGVKREEDEEEEWRQGGNNQTSKDDSGEKQLERVCDDGAGKQSEGEREGEENGSMYDEDDLEMAFSTLYGPSQSDI